MTGAHPGHFAGKATPDGKWTVGLPPVPPSLATTDIEITASSPSSSAAAEAGESVSLLRVLFGDVVICGGQSNMQVQWPL